MAAPGVAEEQLLELLLTLKRATPADARNLLNSQPQIAYALMSTMVNINAVKMEVVEETLAKHGALPGAPSAVTLPAPTVPTTVSQPPPSALPPHIQAQVPPRGSTPTYPSYGPPSGYPPQAPQGYPAVPTGPSRGYGTPPPGQAPGFVPPPHTSGPLPQGAGPQVQPPHAQVPHIQPPPPPPSGPAASGPLIPDALAALPEDQKALIMRVVGMSRDEVYQLPPVDRENIIKLRATLGLPT